MVNESLSPLEKIMAAREKGRTVKVVMAASGPMLGLFTLFGRGVAVDVAIGCSVRDLVCDQLGISPDYLASGIQTIFLDGWAVDGIETAAVASGSVLALSAAMPGLVGATMRRGGHYAVLRGNITHSGTPASESSGDAGTVLIKLFNQVARDLGAHFLTRGSWVEGDRFADFIRAQAPETLDHLEVDGISMSPATALSMSWQGRSVLLSAAPSGD